MLRPVFPGHLRRVARAGPLTDTDNAAGFRTGRSPDRAITREHGYTGPSADPIAAPASPGCGPHTCERIRAARPSPRSSRGSLVPGQFQFVVDELLEFSRRLRAAERDTIDEETRRGRD